jgi:hypothetical protein
MKLQGGEVLIGHQSAKCACNDSELEEMHYHRERKALLRRDSEKEATRGDKRNFFTSSRALPHARWVWTVSGPSTKLLAHRIQEKEKSDSGSGPRFLDCPRYCRTDGKLPEREKQRRRPMSVRRAAASGWEKKRLMGRCAA